MDRILLATNLISFLAGFVVHSLMPKEKVKDNHKFSLFFAMLWASFHIFSFITEGKSVPYMFDIVGMGATANLLGLDIAKYFNKKNEKNNV